VTPGVFQWEGKDVILAGGQDGRLYLLDSASLGGADHHTPLYRSEAIADTREGCGLRGTFATWQDPESKTRWVYVSFWGRANAAVDFPVTNGPVRNGGIAAFKVENRDGKPALVPAWIARDMITPAAPVVANGLVFALSTGQPALSVREDGVPYSTLELSKMAKRATLYALDSSTGKELFSSGNVATSYSYTGGLAVANGVIYFATHDNAVYVYGFPMIAR
jgi:outer membrane protein assembly factor BamB